MVGMAAKTPPLLHEPPQPSAEHVERPGNARSLDRDFQEVVEYELECLGPRPVVRRSLANRHAKPN
jgi:hypothetical protein